MRHATPNENLISFILMLIFAGMFVLGVWGLTKEVDRAMGLPPVPPENPTEGLEDQ